MDPLTAISLASNIISFIDFSSKLIKIALEAKRSGSTEDLDDATIIISSLESTLETLQTPAIPATAPDGDEKLVLLAKNCGKACVELRDLVYKVKGQQRSSSGFGVAWRTLRYKNDLISLEERIGKYRSEILSHLMIMMRQVKVSPLSPSLPPPLSFLKARSLALFFSFRFILLTDTNIGLVGDSLPPTYSSKTSRKQMKR